MTEIEKQLLNAIQSDFPITARPFNDLARELGVSESEVIDLIGGLKNRGVIRRIGAIFDSQKLGYKSTLCAMKVPAERLEEVAGIVSSFPGVTHNYGRDHELNLWFTLIAETQEQLVGTLELIKAKTGISTVLNLPAVNLFKINVRFSL